MVLAAMDERQLSCVRLFRCNCNLQEASLLHLPQFCAFAMEVLVLALLRVFLQSKQSSAVTIDGGFQVDSRVSVIVIRNF